MKTVVQDFGRDERMIPCSAVRALHFPAEMASGGLHHPYLAGPLFPVTPHSLEHQVLTAVLPKLGSRLLHRRPLNRCRPDPVDQ